MIIEEYWKKIAQQKTIDDVAKARGLTPWEDDDGDFWYKIPEASGSDYVGGLLYKSNAQWFEEFGQEEFVYVDWHSASHGGYTTNIKASCAQPDIVNAVEGLEDYSVIDEGYYSQKQVEQEYEDFQNWVKDDFVERILDRITGGQAKFNEMEDLLYDTPIDDLYELFQITREQANVYWEDSNEGLHVDVERVAKELDFDKIKHALSEIKQSQEAEQTEQLEQPQLPEQAEENPPEQAEEDPYANLSPRQKMYLPGLLEEVERGDFPQEDVETYLKFLDRYGKLKGKYKVKQCLNLS